MTFVALVRHGETDWNIHGRLQGSSDIPLNDYGRTQAREAASELAERSWDRVVASPLSRATETATIIGAEIGVELSSTYDDLTERRFGEAEGMTDWEAYSHWPGGRYPGMEPRAELMARARTRLDRLAADHPDESLVVVAHGGTIRAVLDSILRKPSPRILNAGISTLTHDGGAWTVHTVNSYPLSRYRWRA